MKPFRITVSGETLNTDRIELEKDLRSKIGIPPEQPIEFIEDTIRPMTALEKQALLALSEGFKEDEDPAPVKSGHPAYSVNKVVRVELADTAPDVYRLMHNLVVSEDEINALMLRVDINEEEMSAVATDWISQNQNRIDQWLGK